MPHMMHTNRTYTTMPPAKLALGSEHGNNYSMLCHADRVLLLLLLTGGLPEETPTSAASVGAASCVGAGPSSIPCVGRAPKTLIPCLRIFFVKCPLQSLL